MKRAIIPILLFASLKLFAQSNHEHGRAVEFPNVGEYLTLACDFHQHTVFSDGSVWPSIRVQEAVKDNLDAISLTEHLEYQPHKEDIPHPNRNRSFELAQEAAKKSDLIVVNGSEITRNMPPGHTNAIFIKDANKLLIEDPVKVFEEANKQGAFVFWNHPNWTDQAPDGIAKLTPMHKDFIKRKLLHGIEVVNEDTYSKEALQIALDNNLTIMGTSDIHGLIDWQYNVPDGGHRPVTFVFAKERSADAIKEGLFAGRTVVWFNHYLIGKNEYLAPLIKECLQVTSAKYQKNTSVLTVELVNNSDADFILDNLSPYSFHSNDNVIFVKPHGTFKLEVKTLNKLKEVELKFDVLNAVIAPDKNPVLELHISPEE